ncbi:hypothetical protein BLNAU_23082 [Blattamonas nauphoetae]|uniref:Right handed beta helix domain-containing protein n=1 Tax=Blattamonas nauphoetae TaxID=2049346 RepID=A0ABQ9WRP4_9EUKA|nr:hypothetical protein BLNAU_23082 [Blattamonas nauphoetae]
MHSPISALLLADLEQFSHLYFSSHCSHPKTDIRFLKPTEPTECTPLVLSHHVQRDQDLVTAPEDQEGSEGSYVARSPSTSGTTTNLRHLADWKDKTDEPQTKGREEFGAVLILDERVKEALPVELVKLREWDLRNASSSDHTNGDFLASNLTVSSNHTDNKAEYITNSQQPTSSSGRGGFGVIHCKLVDCHATTSSGSHRGGFSNHTSGITEFCSQNVNGCIIIDCSSSYIAGWFETGSWTDRSNCVDATINGLDITGCNASGHTGGLLLQFMNHATVTNVKLSNCRSPNRDLLTIHGVLSELSLSSVEAATSEEPHRSAINFGYSYEPVK